MHYNLEQTGKICQLVCGELFCFLLPYNYVCFARYVSRCVSFSFSECLFINDVNCSYPKHIFKLINELFEIEKGTSAVEQTTLVTTTIPTTTLSTLRTNLMDRTSQPFTTPVNSPHVSSTFHNPNTKTTTKKEKPSSILGIYPKICHTIEEKASTYNASVLSNLFI